MTGRALLTRALVALVLAAVLAPSTATADEKPEPDATIKVAADDLGGFATVNIYRYGNSLLVRSQLDGRLIHSDAEAGEWELILHADRRCSVREPHSRAHLAHFHYGWSTSYGTRVMERIFPDFRLADIGSVEIVHDGPNFHDHSSHTGRHHLACAEVR